MTLEFDLVRLTAQSRCDPKNPAGGKPEYTAADISACLSEVRANSDDRELWQAVFHLLLAKYCGDERSARKVLAWLRTTSIVEWFTNAEHALKRIEPGQVARVTEVALLAYLYPHIEHAANYRTRAAYVGCGQDIWKRVYQPHYAWLLGELAYLEHLGRAAYRFRKYGVRSSLLEIRGENA